MAVKNFVVANVCIFEGVRRKGYLMNQTIGRDEGIDRVRRLKNDNSVSIVRVTVEIIKNEGENVIE